MKILVLILVLVLIGLSGTVYLESKKTPDVPQKVEVRKEIKESGADLSYILIVINGEIETELLGNEGQLAKSYNEQAPDGSIISTLMYKKPKSREYKLKISNHVSYEVVEVFFYDRKGKSFVVKIPSNKKEYIINFDKLNSKNSTIK